MMTIPKPLRPGDTVALVGVSGCLHVDGVQERVIRCAQKLTDLGFRVKVDPTCAKQFGYLSGTDEERAAALNRAFADDEVDGVWCIKGGYGCIRMLEYVDWELIKAHPKPFIGFSDITTLHLAMQEKCGLATFHGPMPNGDAFPGEGDYAKSLLGAIAGTPDAELANPDGSPLKCLRPGVAEGQIIGGNMSLMAAATGTSSDFDTTGRIVFMEEIGEHTYAIDRMLWQMLTAGKFDRCAGIVFGAFTNCTNEYPESGFELDEIIAQFVAKVRVPVLWGLQAGHIGNSLTVPLGRRYRMDAEQGSITLID